ncbi:MAG: hypothetical protein SGI74_12385 [Oligoflexia bacterium]|nr:hypothetical protein [Oligoflexia bacterium]
MPLLGYATPIDLLGNIKKLPVIRIGISASPGNGHQAAGAIVANRLRQLGYQGKLEIVYAEKTKEQLGFLFPPFNPDGESIQKFIDQNIVFIAKQKFMLESELFPKVELAILGADDNHRYPTDLRVDTLLTLQPLKWSKPSTVIKIMPSGKFTSLSLKHLANMGYSYELPHSNDPLAFIKEQLSHTPGLAKKTDGLNAIYREIGHIDLAAAYGHFMNQKQVFTYARGILWAMDNSPELFTKGVVIPVFNSLATLDKIDLKKYLRSSPSLAQKVKVVDILNAELSIKLKEIKRGEILIVTVGSVTKPVFELLYSESSIAPVVEGRNSMNLMHILGRPYLPSAGWEGYPFSSPSDIAEDARLDLSYSIELGEAIGQFLIEAKLPDSKLNAFFSAMRIDPKNLAKDKLFQALAIINKQWDTTSDQISENITIIDMKEAEKNIRDRIRKEILFESCSTQLDLIYSHGNRSKN